MLSSDGVHEVVYKKIFGAVEGEVRTAFYETRLAITACGPELVSGGTTVPLDDISPQRASLQLANICCRSLDNLLRLVGQGTIIRPHDWHKTNLESRRCRCDRLSQPGERYTFRRLSTKML